MNKEIIGKYMIQNDEILPVQGAESEPSSSARVIYEVIRVISGIPIFIERHIERLEASAALLGYSVKPLAVKIEKSIPRLVEANEIPEKNVKIIVYNLNKPIPDYMAFFIESSYPAPLEYANGVPGILYFEERNNPNAKVVNTGFKEGVAAALSSAKAYEAFLVNRNGEITEGSRSNVFFVKEGVVYTAPKGSVLIGITRVCVFELCKSFGIEIVEKPIPSATLKEFEGVFMTGTSPKLLPISKIDNINFSSAANRTIKALMAGYDELLTKYIKEKLDGKA